MGPQAESHSNGTLPIDIFIVGDARFSSKQIEDLLARTNSKLAPIGIQIKVRKQTHVDRPDLAVVTDENVEELLQLGDPLQALRLFLVAEDAAYGGYGSWTYEPLPPDYPRYWSNAIFITHEFNESTDEFYERKGYHPANDSLLHELGHVLMQESHHLHHPSQLNFFQENSLLADDSFTQEQIKRMLAHLDP